MQVIYGGNNVYNAILYGEQHPDNQRYFQRQIESISETLTDIGRSFFANVNDLYEQYNGAEAMRIARAAINNAQSLFRPNVVQSIFTMADMQTAPMVMQRWIMANPVVRDLYHQRRCDGYSDTYKDIYPGDVGDTHYDYRRVMDGVVQTNDEDDTWSVKFYLDELSDGDRDLLADEKVDILNTWEIAEMFIKAGLKDPTSPWDSDL